MSMCRDNRGQPSSSFEYTFQKTPKILDGTNLKPKTRKVYLHLKSLNVIVQASIAGVSVLSKQAGRTAYAVRKG